MSQFTGGRVVYSRKIQPAQYESKGAEVELFFTVGEGEDHTTIADKAQLEAIDRAHAMLGLTSNRPVGKSDKEALAEKQTGGATGTTETGEKQKRQPKKAPNEAKKEDPAAMGEPAAPAGSTTPVPAGAPTASTTATTGATTAPASNPADIEDEFDALPAAEVTDKQLSDEMSKKNAEINDTRRLKELVGKYGVARSRELPQEKRQAFLIELRAMKPAAKAA